MRSLTTKLILAFLVVGLSGIALAAALTSRATTSEFNDFLLERVGEDAAEQLAEYYMAHGSWAGVTAVLPRSPYRNRPGMPPTIMTIADVNGRVLVPGRGMHPGQQLSRHELNNSIPIQVDGNTVGFVLMRPEEFRFTQAEEAFLGRFNRALIIAALGGTAVSLLLGTLLANALTRPLRELIAATRALSRGELGKQVPVRSQDELGQLTASFNQMSADLAHARDLRRQMTADIAHELRTPLSLILGHAEALSDGVLPPTPDTFHILHDEAQRLSRLVEDLRLLSLADAGELPLVRRPLPLAPFLTQIANAYQPIATQQEINLQIRLSPDLPEISADPDRLRQVIGNLMENALRHTPAGGTITLLAEPDANPHYVHLVITDTGPGIPPEDLPHVFERFYRGDKSRHRHNGGSGLGLAIARGIVQAHNGRIYAESQPGQGASFHIVLPIHEAETAVV